MSASTAFGLGPWRWAFSTPTRGWFEPTADVAGRSGLAPRGSSSAAGNVQDLSKKVFRMYLDQNVQDVLGSTPDTAR